jgi:pyruvate/2-oxoglutarate dehydrogenase complex dihydrolipoamide dehydrogenase (E3) component
MAEALTPDICVVGAGSAGLSVAAAAAAFGVSVVLVEMGRMGGDCLNWGCVPSKALLAAAKRAEAVRKAATFGIGAGPPRIDFPMVMAHVRRTIATIAPNDSAARFRALGVEVIAGRARFLDDGTVEAGGRLIRARRFVLATGARPAIPAIPGIDTVDVLTHQTIFDLETLPDHLVTIGAGPVGVELSQAFRRLGSRVTLLDSGTPLAGEDREGARTVLASLERDGVEIVAPASVMRLARRGPSIAVFVDAGAGEASITASHVLVATGRRPVTDGLGLEAAGIVFDDSGIQLGRNLRTTNKRVYAIGDAASAVTGGWQFTHLASHHASLVVRSILFRLPIRASTHLVPRVVYTDPELAQVGETEASAMLRGPVRILRSSLYENDRAQIERAAHGHVKLVATRGGRLVGAMIVGAEAGELISLYALAIAKRMSVRDLAELVFPYPTLSEAGRRAALSFYATRLTKPVLRRILKVLRMLG